MKTIYKLYEKMTLRLSSEIAFHHGDNIWEDNKLHEQKINGGDIQMSMLRVKELKVIISKDPYRYGLLNSVCKTLRWLMWQLENTG